MSDEKIRFGSCSIHSKNNLLCNYLREFKIVSARKFFEKYVNNREIRERFHKLIKFPERQLHVYFKNDDLRDDENCQRSFLPFSKVFYLSADLKLFQEHIYHQLEKVHRLYIEINFPPVESLVLTMDHGIRNLNLYNATQQTMSSPVIPPPSLECLTLNGPFSLLPVDGFSRLHELFLYNNDNVNNVTMLVNIPKLRLHYCNNIVDITPLQRTKDIAITQCDGILDYRNALTYSLRITISHQNPKAVIDVSAFKTVQYLNLDSVLHPLPSILPITLRRLVIGRPCFPLVSSFIHLQELFVSSCSVLTKVDYFSCIPTLILKNLENVTSLNGLGYDQDSSKNLKNKKVSLIMMNKIEDFTPLNSVPVVSILYCNGFRDVAQVQNVKDLTIAYCPSHFLSIPIMCEKITLLGKMNDKILKYFPYVRELRIGSDGERSLEGLETLKNLERIALPSLSCKRRQETRGWEMLQQDYEEVNYNQDTIIYLKKRK